MNNCIFCKVNSGEIKSYKLYEDKNFIVILDRFPSSVGHALVIPKEHYKNIFELPDELCKELFVVVKKIAVALKDTFDLEGLNILQNNGEIAGQSVNHFHIHLIPRYKNDKLNLSWDAINDSEDKFEEATEKIKKFIK